MLPLDVMENEKTKEEGSISSHAILLKWHVCTHCPRSHSTVAQLGPCQPQDTKEIWDSEV